MFAHDCLVSSHLKAHSLIDFFSILLSNKSKSDFIFGTEFGFPLGRKNGLLTDFGQITSPSLFFFKFAKRSKKYFLNSCGYIFLYYSELFFTPYALSGNLSSICSGWSVASL